MTRQRLTWGLAVAGLVAASAAITTGSVTAGPADAACNNRQNNQIDKFLDCVDGGDALVHLQAFQDIADANGGTRASATPGYDESADYVARQLEAAGLTVERQSFQAQIFQEASSSLSVNGESIEFDVMTFSGSGDVVNGTPIAVDLDLGAGNASTSGCEADDFDGLDFSGTADVALIQRGGCTFAAKATNAEVAGAEGVLIFNQGDTDDRKGVVFGTLGGPGVGIPVYGIGYDDGVALADAGGSIDMSVDAQTFAGPTENIITEIPGKNPDNVVMAGAHLDSVIEGPGVQDNGSGSAAILAVALAMANNKQYVPENTVRFAWWADEEQGLNGSFEYFTNADFGLIDNAPEEIDKIAAYMNFDMIASPNFIYGVYDADQSSFPAPAGIPIPDGSAELEDLFEAYYTIEGIPYEDTEFSGRSDYQVFILLDIPASGLFTGAEGIKTGEQASIWGGTAGDQYDPCYHLACDTVDNVSREALDVNVDAVAYAMYNLASTTEAVNGVAGVEPKGTTPSEIEFDGPQGTFLDEGGLAHDHLHQDELPTS